MLEFKHESASDDAEHVVRKERGKEKHSGRRGETKRFMLSFVLTRTILGTR